MQVKDIIATLNNCFKQDEELVVLFYSKGEFDYEPDDEVVLTDEGWNKIVKVMHESGGLDSADQQLSETISEMAGEFAEVVE
jgi:hypothetical protein